MKKQVLSVVIGLAGMSYPFSTNAISLGEVVTVSEPDQPFVAKIELLGGKNLDAADVQANFAPPTLFDQARIPQSKFLKDVEISTQNESGKPFLVLKSTKRIPDDQLGVLLEIKTPEGDLLKKFTIASKQAASPAVVSAEPVAQQAAIPTKPIREPQAKPDIKVANKPSVAKPQVQPDSVVSDSPRVSQPEQPIVVVKAPLLNHPALVEPSVQQLEPDIVIGDAPVILKEPEQVAVVEKTPPLIKSPRVKTAQTYVPFTHRYQIQRGDTLATIMARMKTPTPQNKQQLAAALYQQNRAAFVAGSTQHVKAGMWLKTPSPVAPQVAPVIAATKKAAPKPPAPVTQAKPPMANKPVNEPTIVPAVAAMPTTVAATTPSVPTKVIESGPVLPEMQETMTSLQKAVSDLEQKLAQAQSELLANRQEMAGLKDLVQQKNRQLAERDAALQKTEQQAQAETVAGVAGPTGPQTHPFTDVATVDQSKAEGLAQLLVSPLARKIEAGALLTLLVLWLGYWYQRRSARKDDVAEIKPTPTVTPPQPAAPTIPRQPIPNGLFASMQWRAEPEAPEIHTIEGQLSKLRHSLEMLRQNGKELQQYLNRDQVMA